MSREEPTVAQNAAMEISASRAEPKDVKVEMGASDGMPKTAKLAHVLAAVVSGVIALCVASVLADGKSVIVLKPPSQLPVVTESNLRVHGIHYRLDELLGQTYGIGLHHDQSGRSWTHIGAGSTVGHLVEELGLPVIAGALPRVIMTDALKHPVPLLECNDLRTAGMTAMGFGFIAEAVAVVMLVFHAATLAGLVPAKEGKMFSGLIWATLSAGFLIVIFLAVGIYTATWKCYNPVISTLKLNDHFDYNYGFYFAILGFVSSLLILFTQLVLTSTSYTGATSSPSVGKVIAGVVSGLTVGAVGSIIILAANNEFNATSTDSSINPCASQRPLHSGPGDSYFANTACTVNSITQTLEQAGANVTAGFRGGLDAGTRVPITTPYDQTDLCPVNVHWHLGAEHLSVGEFDEQGTGPVDGGSSSEGGYSSEGRRMAEGSTYRQGFRCRHYDAADSKFTTPFNWQHCTSMMVGETYEIHWPHSAAGACGTQWQYQSPFYDGVFCHDGIITIAPLNTYEKIGVQSQVFTVVNDEAYYEPNLLRGMIMGGNHGADIAKYTGSTTGTTRDASTTCSRYTPITWQVDRKCHLISASSFDKLCQDMKAQADDMSMDLHPHGSRELSATHVVANNQQTRK